MPAPEHPKVFISYTHDSPEHRDRMLTLSDRLRADGIDCQIDQYEESPPEGWPRWMLNQIENADFVLVVCTETYARRFRGREESGKGLGAQWEGAVITQEIYDAAARNTMFIPVLFRPDDSAYIPIVLRGATYYQLHTEQGYEALYRRLTNQPLIRKPELGRIRPMPPLARKQPTTGTPQESFLPITSTTPERPQAQPASTTVQSPPARTSTAVPSEVPRQLERMRSNDLAARERVAAGNALGEHGDPRFRADAWYLPDEPLLGLVEIPAGPFLMGNDKAHDPDAFDNEIPQHVVTLPRYFIGRYPVTVAQFQAFVAGGGPRPNNPESLQGFGNHPVVSVSWYEAQQYCNWLTERLRAWPGTPEPLATLIGHEGWQVGLPSEPEWEKAARGTEGLIYPWGNESDPNRANYDKIGIMSPSAVGCFPGGASPYSIEDMSGNVWEWTRSLEGNYPYPMHEQERTRRENLQVDPAPRVLRGGAFGNPVRYVRCACRGRNNPFNWSRDIGFRVVVRPAS
jgi:formylglycine-generating enzyme required for sulfatase activity